uniref:Lens intrinsic membrane protein 2.3 n=1 Tax=Seriola lalandi dorsalis TaxID=1841481 RepID=A0A3B4XLU7_SERLL
DTKVSFSVIFPLFEATTGAYWDATRAFMILSLLACFIGIVIGVMAFIHYSSFDGFDKTFAAGILFFISCFFVLLAMAVYTGVTVNYYGKRYGSWRFSWSYIMGWVAVVLTFFSGIQVCGLAFRSLRTQ